MTAHMLIACRQMQADLPRHVERLRTLGITWECPPVTQHLSELELLGMVDRFDAIVAGDDEVTEKVLEHAASASRLRVVSKWGVGVDSIDRSAAERLGILVTNTPGVFDNEVADVVIGYVIMLARGLHNIDRAVRQGTWLKIEGRSLSSLTLGVVGVGAIGRAVARRGQAFGMRTLGTDAFASSCELARSEGTEIVTLHELLAAADVVSLNCPLTPETFHLLGDREFALMKPGSFLVNTSRGRVVDQAALVRALERGHLNGAALDVFEEEPLQPDEALASFENVILGSHNASNTREAVQRTSERALDNALIALGLA